MKNYALAMLAVLGVIMIGIIAKKITGYDAAFLTGWFGCVAFTAIRK